MHVPTMRQSLRSHPRPSHSKILSKMQIAVLENQTRNPNTRTKTKGEKMTTLNDGFVIFLLFGLLLTFNLYSMAKQSDQIKLCQNELDQNKHIRFEYVNRLDLSWECQIEQKISDSHWAPVKP